MPDVCASCPVHTGECPLCGTFWFIRNGTKRCGVSPVEKCHPISTSYFDHQGRQRWHYTPFDEMPNVRVQEIRS